MASFREPRVVDYNGNLSKRWYVIAYIPLPNSKETVRKRFFLDINEEKTLSGRRARAEMYLKAIRRKLEAGEKATIIEGTKEATVNEKARIKKLTIVQGLEELMADRKGEITDAWMGRLEKLKLDMPEFWKKPPLLLSVTPKVINELLAHIAESRKKKGKDLAPKTLNDFRALISQVFNHYKHQGLIEFNPTLGTKKKRVKHGTQNFPYSLEQIAQIRAKALELAMPQPVTFTNPRYKQEAFIAGLHQYLLFTEFMFYTLARPTYELRLLRVSDLHPHHVHIRKENSKTSGRLVDIAPPLERTIQRENLRSYPSHYYVFGVEGKPGPEPIGENKFIGYHRRIQKALGWTDLRYTLYSFKHSGAIQMYLATKDLLLVMNHCGHTSVKMTEAYLKNLGMIRNGGSALDLMPEI